MKKLVFIGMFFMVGCSTTPEGQDNNHCHMEGNKKICEYSIFPFFRDGSDIK